MIDMKKAESFAERLAKREEEDIVLFRQGVPGFEHLKRYVLFRMDEQLPFYCLQAADEAAVQFLVVDPFLFYPQYEFELSKTVQSELNIRNEDDVQIFCIVSGAADFKRATLNLMAPIVLNVETRDAQQVILHESNYKTKHPLWPDQPKGEEA